MVDVCTASRSIATADMRDSLLRLTDIARRARMYHADHRIKPTH